MRVVETALPEVRIFEPRVHRDGRGFFYEMWNDGRYRDAGLTEAFVQDNVSRSTRGTLRGLHFQHPTMQGKLVTVLSGSVFDVAVDVRRGSPNFGRWAGVELSGTARNQIWVPRGFAHGFLVTSDSADVLYKVDDAYRPAEEFAIAWDDPVLGIDWPGPVMHLSDRDRAASRLADAAVLPEYDGN